MIWNRKEAFDVLNANSIAGGQLSIVVITAELFPDSEQYRSYRYLRIDLTPAENNKVITPSSVQYRTGYGARAAKQSGSYTGELDDQRSRTTTRGNNAAMQEGVLQMKKSERNKE